MPYGNVRTSLKVLRDKDHLYVCVQSLYPASHPEDLYQPPADGNIFTQEYVELAIAPPNCGGKIYRLAVNPVEGSRYDSVYTPDKRGRMSADVKWNGNWEYALTTSGKKGPYSLPARIWTAWFKIPFSDFRSKPPAAGETWGLNVGRNRSGQSMLWSDGQSATDPKSLGQLVF